MGMPIEAYTGISIQSYNLCLQEGRFLPYNWQRPLNLDYQQQIAREFNHFWYAYPVLDLLVNSHPIVAQKIASCYFHPDFAYESNTAEVAIQDARHHAVWASVTDSFHEATGVWAENDEIASLAWSNESLKSKKTLNEFIRGCSQIGLDPDFDTNTRVDTLRRTLIKRLGSSVELFDILINRVFDSPKGMVVGWTRDALDSAEDITIGEESDREIIIASSASLPLYLFEFQNI